MGRNVEIKAEVSDICSLKQKCKDLSGSNGQVLFQEDYFFYTPNGRLKLRFQGDSTSELIYYERGNKSGPKLSSYQKYSSNEGWKLCSVLTSSLGIKGLIKKKRLLFIMEQTRIHLDTVEGLGTFLELEVCLADEQEEQDGVTIAKQIMSQLGITEESLITVAYIDLIESKKNSN